MRMLRRNKQTIKYAELIGTSPVYVLDENGNKVVDYVEDGVTYYKVTGTEYKVYADPSPAEVNIAFSGGEVTQVEYGINDSSYDASILYLLDEYPITETCLVWHKTEPTYIGTGAERHVDPDSADYKVVMVKPSLNQTKVLLSKLVKQPAN